MSVFLGMLKKISKNNVMKQNEKNPIYVFCHSNIVEGKIYLHFSQQSRVRERWVWRDRCQSKEKKEEEEDSQFPSFLFKSSFLCPFWKFFLCPLCIHQHANILNEIEKVGVWRIFKGETADDQKFLAKNLTLTQIITDTCRL